MNQLNLSISTLLNKFVILIYFLSHQPILIRSENILFFWGVSGKSHRISAWPLIEKLAEKGHKITFISPYPWNAPTGVHPNITDIVPKGLAEDVGLIFLDFIAIRLAEGVPGTDRLWYEYYDSGIRGCDSLLRNQDVLEWINHNDTSFDLVVLDALHNECGYAFAHKFKTPIIMYSPTAPFQWFRDAYGLPDENWPEITLHYPHPTEMTFAQSVWNLLNGLYWQWKRNVVLFPKLESLFKETLGFSDFPPLLEMEMNTSLIFICEDPSEEFPRSLPPNFVNIGGMHCSDDRKPVSQEVANFIADSEGFVLLSFGTYASVSNLPRQLQDVIFNALGQIPHLKFLVKYENDIDPNRAIPSNILLLKWIPQQDIIAHPKAKAFICHGGLLGTQEAVYHSVPTVVIPLFAEQDYNAVRTARRETGIVLELVGLTEGQLVDAILEVTTDPKYKENARKLSVLFRDRQVNPLDSALWWTEYVLRHKNLDHLRPIGTKRTWYERRMLHVWGFLILCIFLAVLCLYYALSSLVKSLFDQKPTLLLKVRGKID